MIKLSIIQGLHNDEKQSADFWQSSTVTHASNGKYQILSNFLICIHAALEKERIAQMKTADDFNKELEEKKKKEEEAKAQTEKQPVVIITIVLILQMTKDGSKFICANKGCSKKSFAQEENGDQECNFHTGDPVFHDLKKYWSCCQKVTFDWDDFMKLPTCAVGSHQIKYK